MQPVGLSAPQGKRERSKIEKRARILDVARRLFREQGYEATTTSQISRAAKIATGTLFLYFASKDELLIELFADRIRDAIRANGENFDPLADPRAQIEDFFMSMILLHEEDPELNRHFIRAIAIIADPRIAHNVNNLARRATLALARNLIRLQRNGIATRAQSPRTAAQVMFGTYFAALVEWANGGLAERELRMRVRSAVGLVMKTMIAEK